MDPNLSCWATLTLVKIWDWADLGKKTYGSGFLFGSSLVWANGFLKSQGVYLGSAFGTSTPRYAWDSEIAQLQIGSKSRSRFKTTRWLTFSDLKLWDGSKFEKKMHSWFWYVIEILSQLEVEPSQSLMHMPSHVRYLLRWLFDPSQGFPRIWKRSFVRNASRASFMTLWPSVMKLVIFSFAECQGQNKLSLSLEIEFQISKHFLKTFKN